MRTRIVSVVIALLGAALVPMAATAAGAAPTSGRFIITLTDSADARAVAAEYRRDGAAIDFVYTAALNGFAGAMSDADLGRLQADRRVTRIERDGIATANATQSGATWGLDRIDQRPVTLDGGYTYTHTGSGVNAYIIDTGIRLTHNDFGGRAVSGYDAVDGGSADDCNGHGTHVAGTVGGTTYGVAKAANLVAVRVLDCNGSGTWSGVIAGLDWVAANRVAPAVANMSLGGGASSSVDAAVNGAIDAGVTVVVAAGNGNQGGKAQDACGYSPARVPAALTIGATTSADAKTSWSNYGDCVDLFAPGALITSAWYDSDSATKTISGTSMAAPHVAGVAALYLEQATLAAPSVVAAAISDGATKNIVTSSKTANNHLLYSLLTAGPAPEPLPTGTVTGTVTSSSGSAIEGATVTASGFSANTDAAGLYTLTLPEGPHTVQVSATGFASQSQNVTVTADQTTTADFALADAPTPTIALELIAGPKAKGVTPVTSSWTDSDTTTTSLYDVYVNGSLHKASLSDTSETTNWRGSGTLTYRVCRAGDTTICSNDVSITV